MTGLAVKRPVTTMMIILILVAFGAMSLLNLRMDLLPNMNIPVAIAYTTYSGASPDQVQNLITEPVEGALSAVTGLDTINSITQEGVSIVVMQFDTGVDIDMAAIDMREAVDMVRGMLPEDADEPVVMKMDINAMSSIYISVSSQTDDLVTLRTRVEEQIQSRLERQAGVASVTVSGGREKEIVVELINDRVRGYGLSETQLVALLAGENRSMPAGSVDEAGRTLAIKVDAEFADIEEIKNLPITTPSGAVILMRDIAEVREEFKERSSYSFLNGNQAITINIQKQSNANTVNVSNAVMSELDSIIAEYPELEISVILDPADYITNAIGSVSGTAVSGTLLAIVILFIFLRKIRATLVVGAAIPLSIIITFSFMYFAGMTLNMMSLGGLTLGVGMLVDNSIVVLESIFRRMEQGEHRAKAAINGAKEVAMSIVASTLTTVSVFVPVAWMGGMMAQVFNDLALSVSFSLGASLLVALTFVPLACALFLDPVASAFSGGSEDEPQKRGPIQRVLMIPARGINAIENGYRRGIIWATDHRKTVVLLALLFFAGSMASLAFVGIEFLPAADQAQIDVTVTMPPGAVIDRTQETALKVLERLEAVPEIINTSTSIGGGALMGGLGGGGGSSASITVALTPMKERERSSTEIADAIRVSLADIAGAEISVEALTSMMSMGTTTADVQYNIVGEDVETLIEVSEDIIELLNDGSVEGLRDVGSTLEETVPQAVVRVNRDRASSFGLTAQTVMSVVNSAVSGNRATVFRVAGDELDVRITKGSDAVNDLSMLETLIIPTPMGTGIPLREIASVEIARSPMSITRLNRETYMTVYGSLSGRDLGAVSRDLEAKIAAEYVFPTGVTLEASGSTEYMDEEIRSMVYAAIVALFVVYAIMAAEFESLYYPAIIMLAVPVALSAGVFGLFVTGQTFGVTAALGIVVLIGVVINNGIVLVDYINLLRGKGIGLIEAVREAGPVRLRAILMATLTTVLGLIPMMLGAQEGSEVMQPLAVVVVFGLTLSTLVTLFVIPAIYISSENFRARILGRRIKFRQIEEV